MVKVTEYPPQKGGVCSPRLEGRCSNLKFIILYPKFEKEVEIASKKIGPCIFLSNLLDSAIEKSKS